MEIMKKFEARWLEEEEGPARVEEACIRLWSWVALA